MWKLLWKEKKQFPRSFCLRMQQCTHENVLLTIHCHELWKQQIQISPNRSSARNIFFIILKVKLSVCSKRVENTHLASNKNRVSTKKKEQHLCYFMHFSTDHLYMQNKQYNTFLNRIYLCRNLLDHNWLIESQEKFNNREGVKFGQIGKSKFFKHKKSRLEKFSSLFIPNYTRKIVWLLVNSTLM